MPPTTEPRSLFVALEAGRRHFVEWGERGAPPLLLQHGMGDHARSWDWIAGHFGTERHVIAPDLRGHGDSDWSRDGAYALSDYILDLAALAQTLDLATFDLVGHSLGGHIALRYAAAFPEQVRSLTVIEGVELPIIRDQRREPTPYPQRLRHWIANQLDRRSRDRRSYATLDDARARMAEKNPGLPRETIEHLTEHGVIAESGKGLRWKYHDACRFRAPDDAHGTDLDEILNAIACPTLLAYGEASWVPLPPPDRLDRLRRHHLVAFPGVSHWLHHQARERFISVLASFLSEPESCPSRTRNSHA